MARSRRDAIGVGVALLNRLAKSRVVDRLGLRKRSERVVFEATKTGFRTAGALTRSFTAATKLAKLSRLPSAKGTGRFDLTPTEDQQLVVGVLTEFAAEVLWPRSRSSQRRQYYGPEGAGAVRRARVEPHRSTGGSRRDRDRAVGDDRSTGRRGDGARRHGSGGRSRASRRRPSVRRSRGGVTRPSKPRNLPAFTGDSVPAAALASVEPRPLFDPFELRTRATRQRTGHLLNGVKSLVPRGAEAELFVIARSWRTRARRCS
ncbi:hypothetical protein EV644_12242 [Kribbella orskensis]|uniref:Uncharacterized protein n=1 Tax=Kribbella orskensis TaxID=2512216 RepID=A0ABY2BAD1_9ACTN|nr:hypothetical protein EV642_12442 [Kribbella sp. VKM Ac-2500]TCO13567.1 hypothetical protein EV644_12242 [Kribbella orskensis]